VTDYNEGDVAPAAIRDRKESSLLAESSITAA
jgi:hypothetical protein